MANWEKEIANLIKPKLGLKADLIIKARLYSLMLAVKVADFKRGLTVKNHGYGRAAAAGALLVFLFSLTSLYAYSSVGVTPGSRLYVLKKTVEQAEKFLSFGEVAKVETYNKFAGRRLEEALILTAGAAALTPSEINQRIEKNIDEAVSDIRAAAAAGQSASGQARVETVQRQIRQSGENSLRLLDSIKNNFSGEIGSAAISQKVLEAKKTIGQECGLPEPEENKQKNSGGLNLNPKAPAAGGEQTDNLSKPKSDSRPAELKVNKTDEKRVPAETNRTLAPSRPASRESENKSAVTSDDKRETDRNRADRDDEDDDEDESRASSAQEAPGAVLGEKVEEKTPVSGGAVAGPSQTQINTQTNQTDSKDGESDYDNDETDNDDNDDDDNEASRPVVNNPPVVPAAPPVTQPTAPAPTPVTQSQTPAPADDDEVDSVENSSGSNDDESDSSLDSDEGQGGDSDHDDNDDNDDDDDDRDDDDDGDSREDDDD